MVTRTYQVVAIVDWCIYNILLLKQSLRMKYSNKMSPFFYYRCCCRKAPYSWWYRYMVDCRRCVTDHRKSTTWGWQ